MLFEYGSVRWGAFSQQNHQGRKGHCWQIVVKPRCTVNNLVNTGLLLTYPLRNFHNFICILCAASARPGFCLEKPRAATCSQCNLQITPPPANDFTRPGTGRRPAVRLLPQGRMCVGEKCQTPALTALSISTWRRAGLESEARRGTRSSPAKLQKLHFRGDVRPSPVSRDAVEHC